MIDATTGVSFGALALAVASFGWLWNRVGAMIAAERAAREAIAAELADYKLESLRIFVTAESIEKTEARLVNAIDKMTARLETVISRFEGLQNEVARLSARRDERAAKPTRRPPATA